MFFREGSISVSKVFDIELLDTNSAVVAEIEKHAQNNIELTLDGVVDFMNRHDNVLKPMFEKYNQGW